jgi:EAL domain-containing protein (putative c-di-GMP-specific phosphodiesterase class I)
MGDQHRHLQLRRSPFDLVLRGLACSRLPAERLELEIGDAILVQDNHNALALFNQLRQLGMRILMHDFAAGIGSLSDLRSFPFNKVKIGGGLIA